MDGYLADSQHRIDWLHQFSSVEDTGYDDFYRQMDVTIMGKTFEEIQGLPDVEGLLSGHRKLCLYPRHKPACQNYQPVAGDVVDFVEATGQDKKCLRHWWKFLGRSSFGCGPLWCPITSRWHQSSPEKGIPLYPEGGPALLSAGWGQTVWPLCRAGFQPKHRKG